METNYDINDFKPDMNKLGFVGFQEDAEMGAPAPPPYHGNTPASLPSPPSSPQPTAARRMSGIRPTAFREWVGSRVMRASSTSPPPPDVAELPAQPFRSDVMLAPHFQHRGDVVLVADGVGFQVDSRVLSASSATLEAMIGRKKLNSPAEATVILNMHQHSEEDIHALLGVITPYAFTTRPNLSLEALATVADLFDTFAMRPAARFGLARIVEFRSATTMDVGSVDQCVAWTRLAHKVRSVPTLKKALGVTNPSALRDYWLLSDRAINALQPHLYRALVLIGNTHALLGDEGLATIQFKYQDGQLCLTNAAGEIC